MGGGTRDVSLPLDDSLDLVIETGKISFSLKAIINLVP
jgi:hypothetical protein